jgi:hypothetical protein
LSDKNYSDLPDGYEDERGWFSKVGNRFYKKGRSDKPVYPIDWETVKRFATAGCSGVEIAAAIGISAEALYDRCKKEHGMYYSAYQMQYKQKGDALIREKQYELALEKDRVMLIWLGKQRLGQKETPTDHHEMPAELKG